MTRSILSRGRRRARWAALVAAVPALWACGVHTLGGPAGAPVQVVSDRFVQATSRDLDILFMIDDSSSMAKLQAKMQARLPEFIDVLRRLPDGLPDLHIAVVSSSLGAGNAGGPSACDLPGGDDGGAFVHRAACTALASGHTFITASQDGTKNDFSGDLAELFRCMALLGESGCGFEHQLASPMVALQRAMTPCDANAGFLRPDAFFALVLLTNEDDGSVPPDSMIYDPSVASVTDPSGRGGLQSYRQNEFGHLCGGKKLPHLPPPAPLALEGCASDEDPDPRYADRRHEVRVRDLVDFFSSLKPDPSKILVAAMAGPATPYVVDSAMFDLPGGGRELQPAVRHSCMLGTGEYADPAVRIKQFIDAFGPDRGVFRDICMDDFASAMEAIAVAIGKGLGPSCVKGNLRTAPGAGHPDCAVTARRSGPDRVGTPIPACDAALGELPCWRLLADPAACPAGLRAQICRDPTCGPDVRPAEPEIAAFDCAVGP